MNGRDGSLQRLGTEAAGRQGALHQGDAFAGKRVVPSRAILLFEQHQFTRGADSGLTPRVVEQHERDKADDFRLRYQLEHNTAQANRFAGQFDPRERGP